jgi:hypothetical protein
VKVFFCEGKFFAKRAIAKARAISAKRAIAKPEQFLQNVQSPKHVRFLQNVQLLSPSNFCKTCNRQSKHVRFLELFLRE